MNWKSTALVSGAGLLVTWLANQPPRAVQVASARAPQAALAPASDIQQQAEHLRVRVRREVELSDPARNPFRFAPRPAPQAPVSIRPLELQPVAPVAAPPSVRLSGIAVDNVDGREEKTAILNTAAGLVFAHEGEQVAGRFQVRTISEEAVVLIRLDDGSELILR